MSKHSMETLLKNKISIQKYVFLLISPAYTAAADSCSSNISNISGSDDCICNRGTQFIFSCLPGNGQIYVFIGY